MAVPIGTLRMPAAAPMWEILQARISLNNFCPRPPQLTTHNITSMGFRKTFLDKMKPIFRTKSSRAEHPLEENDSRSDVLIASGSQPPGFQTHSSRPNSPGGGNHWKDVQITRAEDTGDRDDNGAPTGLRSDGERILVNADNAPLDNRLEALDLGHVMDRQYQSGQQDVNSMEKFLEIRGTNPSTSENRKSHRAAARNDEDREFLAPLMQPSIGHPPSESMRFDLKNSVVSSGEGPVNVNNVNSGNTTTLIQNNNASERIRPGLKLLQKRVATSAFHNSAQRVDPPRCHPDTRVAIQKQIYDWIVLLLTRETWIMWMHGAAGAGKSAIMQSIAERCEEAQIPLASFFFFRTDPTRNSMVPFIATLVYQLVQKIPQVWDEIFSIIERNPLIFDESLQSQLQKLIIQPLRRAEHFFVVLIDGLDECVERAQQTDLIKLVGSISRSRSTPVIFLIGSRREPQIEAAFVRKEVSDLVLTLPLDNSDIEQTSDDIRHYLVDKFSDIKETHLLKRHLPIEWPPVSFIEEIVKKSSGQFIFASIVINYVSSPRTNPAHQLEIVRGIRLRDPSSLNPFAHLDALYQHIFSQVIALDRVLDIIAFVIACGLTAIPHIERVFLLEAGEMDVLFADLAAVIICEQESSTDPVPHLKFLHASLPDFLLDKIRSEHYHIDLDEYRTKLLCMLLERSPPTLDPLWLADVLTDAIERERSRLLAIQLLLGKTKASEQLCIAFMKFSSTFYADRFLDHPWDDIGSLILQYLKPLDFSDQGKAYRHVVDLFAAEYAMYWPYLTDGVKVEIKEQSSDIVVRINQILEQPKFKQAT